LGKLDGQVALITGGRRGMGAEHARLLAAHGAMVVVGDVLARDDTTADPELPPGNALYVPLDVTQEADWRRTVAAAENRFGPIGILVNNAAVYDRSPITDTDLASWQRVIEVNLSGTFLGMKTVAPSMQRNGHGSIINISSTAGLKGMPGLGAYGASKWAVRGLTKTAALEFAPDRIRVNSVHPGIIRTSMAEGVSPDRVSAQPIDRWGQPDDVAQMVLFLAGEESSYCTGSEFVVDGGSTTGSLAGRTA
jgi:3alpha(or 20beta)-hydroxysteroid dehydrogenase